MTTLENLYYGNISPADNNIKRVSEYSKFFNLSVRNEETFVLTLSQEQKIIFEKNKDCITEMLGISEKEAFVEGVKPDIKIIAESFHIDSQNFI